MNPTYEAYRQAVEAGLSRVMSGLEAPEPLKSAMAYSLLAGGKRLRPVLLLAACDMAGGGADQALPFACAIEMIHTYSLIHDDLPAMDDDDLRRGKPTNHRVFGEGMALLAGDGLLTLAFEVMLEAGETLAHIRAMRRIALAAGSKGMAGGQCLDLVCGEKGGTADDLAAIHRHKTADMFVGSVTAGLILGGAPEPEIAAGALFASALGTAFQIRDDLLDVEGDAAAMGKATGMDAARGKLTWPRLHGTEAARQALATQTEEALAALAPFGGRAAFLAETARRLLARDA